jgi:hypothetical protein
MKNSAAMIASEIRVCPGVRSRAWTESGRMRGGEAEPVPRAYRGNQKTPDVRGLLIA